MDNSCVTVVRIYIAGSICATLELLNITFYIAAHFILLHNGAPITPQTNPPPPKKKPKSKCPSKRSICTLKFVLCFDGLQVRLTFSCKIYH